MKPILRDNWPTLCIREVRRMNCLAVKCRVMRLTLLVFRMWKKMKEMLSTLQQSLEIRVQPTGNRLWKWKAVKTAGKRSLGLTEILLRELAKYWYHLWSWRARIISSYIIKEEGKVHRKISPGHIQTTNTPNPPAGSMAKEKEMNRCKLRRSTGGRILKKVWGSNKPRIWPIMETIQEDTMVLINTSMRVVNQVSWRRSKVWANNSMVRMVDHTPLRTQELCPTGHLGQQMLGQRARRVAAWI